MSPIGRWLLEGTGSSPSCLFLFWLNFSYPTHLHHLPGFFFQSLFIPPVNIPLACPCSKLYFYPKCICCASCCRDFTVRSLTGMDVEQSVWTMRVCVKGLGALIWLELNQSYTKSTHTHTRAQNAHMNLLPNFVVMNAHTSRSIGALHQHTNPLCLFDLLLGIRQSLPGGF